MGGCRGTWGVVVASGLSVGGLEEVDSDMLERGREGERKEAGREQGQIGRGRRSDPRTRMLW